MVLGTRSVLGKADGLILFCSAPRNHRACANRCRYRPVQMLVGTITWSAALVLKYRSFDARKTRPSAPGRRPVFEPGCFINTNTRGGRAGGDTRAGAWGAGCGGWTGQDGQRGGCSSARPFLTPEMAAANGIARFKRFGRLFKNWDERKFKKDALYFDTFPSRNEDVF